MSRNKKKVLCTVIVHEIDPHGSRPPREARASVEAASVAVALKRAEERVMGQLKDKH